jgi:hypothetical protein
MWPFKKTALDRTIDVEEMPSELAIRYWEDLSFIAQWFYKTHVYESQRYIKSDERKTLPLRDLIESIGAVGRLEQFPNLETIAHINNLAIEYKFTCGVYDPAAGLVTIHPNIRSFLDAPENIIQPVLNTLFRKLSGRRLDRGDRKDIFRNGIVKDLFANYTVISGIAGYPQVAPDYHTLQSIVGPYARIDKEFDVWSMSALPLTYEYFDAMKVATEYARVRPLEGEIPAICMHPMCRKRFKIDSRIADLFRFHFWDNQVEFIATFCSDAHAFAARENGIRSLRSHVDFVSNLPEHGIENGFATPENQLSEYLNPDLAVAGHRYYVKYPLCKQPFYVEFHRLLHSVYDDSTWDSKYIDDNAMTPLEVGENIHQYTVPTLEYWLNTFIQYNLYVNVDSSQPEKEQQKCRAKEAAILGKIQQILLRDSRYRSYPLTQSFPKYY